MIGSGRQKLEKVPSGLRIGSVNVERRREGRGGVGHSDRREKRTRKKD